MYWLKRGDDNVDKEAKVEEEVAEEEKNKRYRSKKEGSYLQLTETEKGKNSCFDTVWLAYLLIQLVY